MPSDDSIPFALARSAPETLRDALHAHLRSVVDKPLGTRMLLELEQAASLASKLLIISGEPRAMPLGRRGGGGGMVMGMDYQPDVVSPLDFADGVPAVPAAFGASENFGAEALRNLISGLQQPKLRDLLDSLETAERMLGRCPAADKPHYTKLVRQLRAKVSAQMVDDGEPGDPDFVEPPEPHDDRVDSPVAVALDSPDIEVWHSGECSRCGRKLTDPTSIEGGLGPVCADYYDVSTDRPLLCFWRSAQERGSSSSET